MSRNADRDERPRRFAGLGGARTLAGIVLAILLVVFIVMNREETEISFIVFDSTTSLWVALALAAAGGLAAGFLLGRRRYRR